MALPFWVTDHIDTASATLLRFAFLNWAPGLEFWSRGSEPAHATSRPTSQMRGEPIGLWSQLEYSFLRKRYYILFVSRDSEGELRKIPIPLHYAYVFIAGAFIGMLSITGMAGSYTRMLVKTLSFNKVRQEKEQLKD